MKKERYYWYLFFLFMALFMALFTSCVIENRFTANGQTAGNVKAHDPDVNQLLVYSIVGENKGFTIDSGTGKVIVSDVSQISGEYVNILVKITDNGSPPLSAQATVKIKTKK